MCWAALYLMAERYCVSGVATDSTPWYRFEQLRGQHCAAKSQQLRSSGPSEALQRMTPRSLHNAMETRGGPDRMRSIGSVAGMLGRARGQPIDKTLSEIDSLMNERRGIIGGSSVGDADEAEAAAAAAAAAAASAAARATRRVGQNKTYSAPELGVAALRLRRQESPRSRRLPWPPAAGSN